MFEHYDILDAPIKKKVVASVWAIIALVFYVLLTVRLCSLFIQDGIESGVIDVEPKLAAQSLKSLLVLGMLGILATLISLIRKERWDFVK